MTEKIINLHDFKNQRISEEAFEEFNEFVYQIDKQLVELMQQLLAFMELEDIEAIIESIFNDLGVNYYDTNAGDLLAQYFVNRDTE